MSSTEIKATLDVEAEIITALGKKIAAEIEDQLFKSLFNKYRIIITVGGDLIIKNVTKELWHTIVADQDGVTDQTDLSLILSEKECAILLLKYDWVE